MSEFTHVKQNHNNIKVRESGIELLRILSIFFVVVIHEITSFLTTDNLFVVVAQVFSWPAIFCFAFITGYFLIFKSDTESKIKRFLCLTLEFVIWKVLIAFIFLFVLTFVEHYSVGDFFGHFFDDIILTLFDVKSWYFWAIIFIYLVFPFFANYLKTNYQFGKKLLLGILIFLGLISVIATVAFFLVRVMNYNFSLYQDSYTIVVVLLAAILGAYWHLIEHEKKIQYGWKLQLIGLVGLLVIYMINFSCYWWLHEHETVLTYLNIFWYLAGWFYFLIFKGFKFHSKVINYWAGLSWGIYILHNGTYLPRGWAPRLVTAMNLDPYLSTILSILFCYVFGICLVLATQNFDRFIFKPHVWPAWRIAWTKLFHTRKKVTKVK